jgi:hypothetical protein
MSTEEFGIDLIKFRESRIAPIAAPEDFRGLRIESVERRRTYASKAYARGSPIHWRPGLGNPAAHDFSYSRGASIHTSQPLMDLFETPLNVVAVRRLRFELQIFFQVAPRGLVSLQLH